MPNSRPQGFRHTPRSSTRAWPVALALITMLLASIPNTLRAQTLVKDINQVDGADTSLGPRSFVDAFGSAAFFIGTDDQGREPWISDGTIGGSGILKDIDPGTGSSSPSEATAYGGDLYFFADDGVHGYEIWKTDGTEGGTALAVDLVPGAGSRPEAKLLAASGGLLYFVVRVAGTQDVEFYTTDGTAGGTTLVKTFSAIPGTLSGFEHPVAFAGGLLFQLDDPTDGEEPWFSDGTEVGTIQLDDINSSAGADSDPGPFLVLPGPLAVFPATKASGVRELWKTDGTAAGTAVAVAGSGVSGVGPPVLFDGDVYFSATDGGTTTGQELYRSNGVTIQLAAEIRPGVLGSSPSGLATAGAKLYFHADDGPTSGRELWSYDTTSGAALVEDIDGTSSDSIAPIDPLYTSGSVVYFAADDGSTGRELWWSDGTTVEQVADIDSGTDDGIPGAFGFENLGPGGGVLLFEADDGSHGVELWRASGSPPSATRLTDVVDEYGDSRPKELTALADGVYFQADDGVIDDEAWVTDGTAAGTLALGNLASGSNFVGDFTRLGSLTLFISDSNTEDDLLYAWDGTTATALTAGSGERLFGPIAVAGPWAILRDFNDGLWITDGTVGGTQQIPGVSIHSQPRTFGGSAYFAGDDGSGDGIELWKTDGATATLVKDVDPIGDGAPFPLAATSSHLFFVRDDVLAGGSGTNLELWRTDGTSGGTVFVTALSDRVSKWTIFADELVYGTWWNTPTFGGEVWRSDGSGPGTSKIADLRVRLDAGTAFVPAEGRLYMVVNDYSTNPSSRSIHVWHGTATPPAVLRATRCLNSSLASVGGSLFFRDCTDGTVDGELWTSDGTIAGTVQALDTEPGPAGSDPSGLVAWNGSVYFAATRSDVGRELFRYDVPLFADGFESGDTTAWQ